MAVVAAQEDYGKPWPAVIVQSDALPETHASVVIRQMTSELSDAAHFRVSVEPNAENGLRKRSQVMADMLVAVRRERIGQVVGRLGDDDIGRLNVALAFVVGLSD